MQLLRYFTAGEDGGFTVEGEPKREASGDRPAPQGHVHFLLIAQGEQDAYADHVAPKSEVAFAKTLPGHW